MRFRVLVLGVLTAVASAGPPVGGQDDKELKEPYAFFGKSPTEPGDRDPTGKVTSLYLRPNLEQQAYVFVRNPTNADATVNVILSSGAKDLAQAGTEIARANGVAVKSKQTIRVALAAAGKPAAPVPPPPPAPPPAAGEKAPPPAPPTPAGVKLGKTKLSLRVEYADEMNPKLKDANTRQELDLDVLKPSERLNAKAEYVPAAPDKPGQFVVTVSFKEAKNYSFFTDKSAKIRLDLRPDLNPNLDPDSLTSGTYEAELTPDGTAQLVAEGVRFRQGAERKVVVTVSVDGYDRAFLFETDFRAPNPAVYTGTFVNVKPSVDKLVPGQPCRIQLEYTVDNEDGLDAELRVDRRGLRTIPDGARLDLVKRFPGLRQKEIYVQAGGPDDAVVFTTVYADWVYDFPTANVFGVRTFQVLGVSGGADQRFVPSADAARDAARYGIQNARPVVFDRTPPVVAEFVRPRGGLVTGSRVTVQARVREDLTGFKQVLFYLGDPPAADAKLVPGKLVKGTLDRVVSEIPNGPREAIYKATLTLPDTKGAVQMGVRVVNEVGIASVDSDDPTPTFAVVDVRDPPSPKEKEKEKTTGTITGRVVQGSRAQPGLPVDLRDEGGKLIKATKTDENGQFKFEEVPPGAYVVSSAKKFDSAKGSDKVAVEAGKTATASINVLR